MEELLDVLHRVALGRLGHVGSEVPILVVVVVAIGELGVALEEGEPLVVDALHHRGRQWVVDQYGEARLAKRPGERLRRSGCVEVNDIDLHGTTLPLHPQAPLDP
ncbi:unannotated protein [freshwater metagenome]|uniref:Unannotated protein n=1 Tax=freshwater metagenome TaxID=449393 RepID=A0A6J7E1S0_9ZZZZ